MTVMKTKATLITLLLAAVVGFTNATPVDGRDVVRSRRNNVFAFTTDRAMRGAEVKVFYSNGDMLVSERMRRRRIVIDFAEVRRGTYTILLTKDGMTKKFQYEKR